MTQPAKAKAQEPSMEEILASIRRIIADDETKPAVAEAAPPAPKPAPSRGAALNPAPSRFASTPPAPAASRPPVQPAPPAASHAPSSLQAVKPSAPPPAPPSGAKNSQDDIDAMLAGLDADTSATEVRAPEPESDVFELTEQMTIPDEPPMAEPSSFHQVNPQNDIEFSEPQVPASTYQAPAYDPPPPPAEQEVVQARPLLSSSTMASVESAFHTLAGTVLSNNARTLEDLVKEMLRPMLKSWLDDNLPNMVEKIVRAEIERVSRGR